MNQAVARLNATGQRSEDLLPATEFCVRVMRRLDAVLLWSEDGLNSSNSLSDAFIALAAEEVVLSVAPGDSLCSLGLRSLQTVRAGPVVATACVRGRPGQVAMHDSGNGNRLSVVAMAGTVEARDPARGVE